MELGIVKLSSNGQIVIPRELRDSIKAKPGSRFLIYDKNGKIILEPIDENPKKVKSQIKRLK